MRNASRRLLGRLSLLALTLAGPSCLCAADGSKETVSSPTLREAAALGGRHLLIGTAISSRELFRSGKEASLIGSQFNSLTADNEFKPENLQPEPGSFTFTNADRIADFAQRHQMKLIGHTLVWHHQAPVWLYQDARGKPLPREQALANMKTHIETVVHHFKGKVTGWDVVNEAIADEEGGYLRDTPALRAIGEDYVARAFAFARAADPSVELYYNDFNIEEPSKREKTIRLLKSLEAEGIHVDGVGIQGHYVLSGPEMVDNLDASIPVYRDLGYKVMLTEVDVDVLARIEQGAEIAATQAAGENPFVRGLPAEIAQQQADYYGKLFGVVLKYPGAVTRVTLWGTQDGESWLNDWPVRGRTNHPLLFDRKLQPKPAYVRIIQLLESPSPAATGR